MELMLEEVLGWLQGLSNTDGKSLHQVVEEGAMLDQVARVVNKGLRDARARLRDEVNAPGSYQYEGELSGSVTVEVKDPKMVLPEDNVPEFIRLLKGHVSPTMVYDKKVRRALRPDALTHLKKLPSDTLGKALHLLEQVEEAPRVQFYWEK